MLNTAFSIIIPVYNTNPVFLDECLDSVLNQSYSNYEIIIIDDGSNIQTKEHLKKYEKTCKVIHQENKGISGSRLTGLKAAKGDYIIHLDSDDIIALNSLEIINNIILEYRSEVIIQDPSRFYKDYKKVEFRNTYFNEGELSREEVLKELCKLHASSICNKFVKRELYEDMENNIDTSFINGEDMQQSTYVILKAKSYYYTLAPIYFYRLNEEVRDYYKTINLNDVNYTVPTYRMLFEKNHNYDNLLGIYKNFTANYVVYTAFKICALYKNRKEKNQYLDELNNQPIIAILNSIKQKTSLITTILYFLLSKKMYLLTDLAAHLYQLVYGFDKSTFK